MDSGFFLELLHKNGKSELRAAWHMRLALAGQNTGKYQTRYYIDREILEKGIQDESDVTILCYM